MTTRVKSLKTLEDVIALLGTPEYRYRWWSELEREQPRVAARLVAKWPERYPVTPP